MVEYSLKQNALQGIANIICSKNFETFCFILAMIGFFMWLGTKTGARL